MRRRKKGEGVIEYSFRRCTGQRLRQLDKKADIIRTLSAEGLAPYVYVKVSETKYIVDYNINPDDKSIAELLKDKDSWIFKGHKPARFCSFLLSKLSFLNSKEINHGNLNEDTIYTHEKSLYLVEWGLECLSRVVNDTDSNILSKDVRDFKTVAKLILKNAQEKSESLSKFLKLLEKDNVTLEELQSENFIVEVRFPIYTGYYNTLCKGEHVRLGNNVEKIKINNQYFSVKRIEFERKKHDEVRREASILKEASENCDYVVKYYEFWIEEKKNEKRTRGNDEEKVEGTYILFIKVEYCDTTLLSISTIPRAKRILFIKQLLLGIKSLHEKKIVHGDLKADNIFIGNTLKIGDFGTSNKFEGTDFKTGMEEDLHNLSLIIYNLYTGDMSEIDESKILDSCLIKEPIRDIISILHDSNSKTTNKIDFILEKYDAFFKKYEAKTLLRDSLENRGFKDYTVKKIFNLGEREPINPDLEMEQPFRDYLYHEHLEKYILCIENIMKVHCVEELEHFPFSGSDYDEEYKFLTPIWGALRFRASPYCFLVENIERNKDKQHLRYFNIRPSYKACLAEFDPKNDSSTKSEEPEEPEDKFTVIVEYAISVPLESDSKYEAKAFYLFEALLTLKDCIMEKRDFKLEFTLTISEDTISEPSFYDFLSTSKYKNMINNLRIIRPETEESDFYEEPEVSFEARINDVLVAKGGSLIGETEDFLGFGFIIIVSSLPRLTDKMSYNTYSICPERKKITINMPWEQYTWLEAAKSFWEKRICSETVVCTDIIEKLVFTDESQAVERLETDDEELEEKDFSPARMYYPDDIYEPHNQDEAKKVEEKEREGEEIILRPKDILRNAEDIGDNIKKVVSSAQRCLDPKRVEGFEILIDPCIKGLSKHKVLEQVEAKWEHLYSEEVAIVVTGESISNIFQIMCEGSFNSGIFTKKEITKGMVIVVAYPQQEDGKRNFEDPRFFPLVNHKKKISLSNSEGHITQKREKKKKTNRH